MKSILAFVLALCLVATMVNATSLYNWYEGNVNPNSAVNYYCGFGSAFGPSTQHNTLATDGWGGIANATTNNCADNWNGGGGTINLGLNITGATALTSSDGYTIPYTATSDSVEIIFFAQSNGYWDTMASLPSGCYDEHDSHYSGYGGVHLIVCSNQTAGTYSVVGQHAGGAFFSAYGWQTPEAPTTTTSTSTTSTTTSTTIATTSTSTSTTTSTTSSTSSLSTSTTTSSIPTSTSTQTTTSSTRSTTIAAIIPPSQAECPTSTIGNPFAWFLCLFTIPLATFFVLLLAFFIPYVTTRIVPICFFFCAATSYIIAYLVPTSTNILISIVLTVVYALLFFLLMRRSGGSGGYTEPMRSRGIPEPYWYKRA